MKVKELTKTTMIEVPDEWGNIVKRLKEIMPTIKVMTGAKNTVSITIRASGAYDVTISNYSEAKAGEHWCNFCEYVDVDGSGYTYASDYVKGDE